MSKLLPRALAAATSLIALAGCTSYRAQPLDPSVELATLTHRDLATLVPTPAFAPGAIDLSDGLDERELVAIALRLNPDLAIRRAALGQAEAALIDAGLWPNPELGLAVRGGAPGVTADADLLMALLRPGERSARTAAAEAGQDAARASVAAQEWEVVAAVRRARLEILSAEALRAAAGESADLAQKVATAMAGRLALGEATDLDVASAAWDAADARRQEREARARLIHAQQDLDLLCGLPADARLTLTGFGQPLAVGEPGSPIPADLDGGVLMGRWELAEAKAVYARAEHRLHLAITKQYPSLKVGPSASRDEQGTTFGLGLSLELPIFDRNQGGIRAAESERDQARATYVAVLHHLLGEAHSAAADLTRARDEVQTLDAELMPPARRAMELADKAVQAHGMTLIEYLATRRQWLAAQRVRLEAIVAFGRAGIALDAALGRGASGLPRPLAADAPRSPTDQESHP